MGPKGFSQSSEPFPEAEPIFLGSLVVASQAHEKENSPVGKEDTLYLVP